jgi:hypothetical protein
MIYAIDFAAFAFFVSALVVLKASDNPELDLKFEWSFTTCFGLSMPAVFIVRDQSAKTHATTWWRLGVVLLCFQLVLNIHWANRPAAKRIRFWAFKQLIGQNRH